MFIPHIINEKSLTIIINNKSRSIASNHPNFTKIKALLIAGKYDEVESLFSIKTSIENMGGGDLSIVGNSVLYLGHEIPNYQSEKLLSMYRDGHKNITPYKNMVCRLESNTSARAKNEFARFADYKQLPIDEDGFVYAWKGVRSDFYSVMGNTQTRVLKGKVDEDGHIFNGVGEEIEVLRSDVDDDCNRCCSFGVHAGSRDYAKGWGHIMMLVKFDPKDVVSIPTDCQSQKMRLCHYWVVAIESKEVEEPKDSVLTNDGKNMKGAKTDTYSDKEYLTKMRSIIRKSKLTYKDSDVITFEMNEAGFYNAEKIANLIERFKIATKIMKYVDLKGGVVGYKKIQSAMKSYKLKYADIDSITSDFGNYV